MKIYVAGKITGLEREATVSKFERARQELTSRGYTVLIPTVLPVLEELSHEDYLHMCFAMIDVCEAVYMLADWERSKGAKMELQYAKDKRNFIMFQVVEHIM